MVQLPEQYLVGVYGEAGCVVSYNGGMAAILLGPERGPASLRHTSPMGGLQRLSTTSRVVSRATVADLYSAPGKAELVNGELLIMSPTGGAPGRAGGEIYT